MSRAMRMVVTSRSSAGDEGDEPRNNGLEDCRILHGTSGAALTCGMLRIEPTGTTRKVLRRPPPLGNSRIPAAERPRCRWSYQPEDDDLGRVRVGLDASR